MRQTYEKIKGYLTENKKLECLINIGLIIGILLLVLPFVLAAGYTYLCEDDFSFEGGALDAAEQYGQIKGAFHAAHRYYKIAQGTYFANMVWHIVRPYIRWGLPGFHLMMIASIITFIFSLSLTIRIICKKKNYSLAIIFLTFFTIWGMNETFNLKELLFWYTGTVNFTWVLSFSLFTLSLQLKIKEESNRKKQWILVGISSITALIGSGGALMITGTQCSWLLMVLILFYDEIKEKKVIIIPFLVAFGGALWNVCAPGNYVRVNELYGEQTYSVVDAILDTAVLWKESTINLFSNPLFLILLTTAFILTFFFEGKILRGGIQSKKMIMIAAGVFATQYLTAFPAILGYNGAGLHNQRTSATYELVLKIMFIFGVICLAQWSKENIQLMKKLLPAMVVILLVFGLVNTKEIKDNIKEGYAYNLTKELLNGTIRDVYKVREAILSQIDSAPDGADLIIVSNPIPENRCMYGMGLLENPNEFVNESAARLFRVNSITVTYQ